MLNDEILSKSSADAAREKTEASIKAQKTREKEGSAAAGETCDVVDKMISFENDIRNISPNATNIQD